MLNPLRNRKPYDFAESRRLIAPPGNAHETLLEQQKISKEVISLARQRGETMSTSEDPALPDLTGLVLQQGELTYLVNQRPVLVEKPELRTAKGRHWKFRKEGTSIILDEFGRHVDEAHTATHRIAVVDLDVRDKHGNLVSKTSYGSQQEFLDFLDSHTAVDKRKKIEKEAYRHGWYLPDNLRTRAGNVTLPLGEIKPLGFGEIPTPVAELDPADRTTISLPISGKESDLFDEAFRQREQLYLPGESWFGLTLITKKGNKLQVTQDELLFLPDPPDNKAIRTWQINEYDPSGNQVEQKKRVFRDNELREFLKANEKTITDLHWEVSKKTIKEARKLAQLGRVALGATGPEVGNRHLSLEDAFEVLSSPDLHDDAKVKEKAKKLKKNVLAIKVAKSLQDLIAEHGTTAVNELAEKMKSDYLKVATQLGLELKEEQAESISWALWDLAEQRYYALHPDEAGAERQTDKYGIKVGDPMGSPRESKRKQREIVDIEVGLAFLDNVIKPALAGEKKNVVDADGFVEQKDLAKLTFQVDQDHVYLLREFVKTDVTNLIERIAKDLIDKQETFFDPKTDEIPENIGDNEKALNLLKPGQLARLGRLLRREFQQ